MSDTPLPDPISLDPAPPGRTPPATTLSAAPSRRPGPRLSAVEVEEARWANTFSLGTFRLVLMPLLVLVFLIWLLIWAIFGW